MGWNSIHEQTTPGSSMGSLRDRRRGQKDVQVCWGKPGQARKPLKFHGKPAKQSASENGLYLIQQRRGRVGGGWGKARVDGLGWDGVGCGEVWRVSWGGVCWVDWRSGRRRSAHDTLFHVRAREVQA